MSSSSLCSTYSTLSSATTSGQRGPGSDDNEGVLWINQSSHITETSPSDWLVSYPGHFLRESAEMLSVYSAVPVDWDTGHLFGESYPSAEMLSVYTAAPTDWAT